MMHIDGSVTIQFPSLHPEPSPKKFFYLQSGQGTILFSSIFVIYLKNYISTLDPSQLGDNTI